jgi:S1-C subfamily serine protease
MARKAGLRVGDKIAVIGSPFEAYWARTAGLQIVGVVPPWRVAPFQELTAEKRAMIEREFARAGAKAVVAQVPQPPTADSGWKAYEYIGWIKALPRP